MKNKALSLTLAVLTLMAGSSVALAAEGTNPRKPTNFRAVCGTSDRHIDLSWEAPTRNVYGYKVRVGTRDSGGFSSGANTWQQGRTDMWWEFSYAPGVSGPASSVDRPSAVDGTTSVTITGTTSVAWPANANGTTRIILKTLKYVQGTRKLKWVPKSANAKAWVDMSAC